MRNLYNFIFVGVLTLSISQVNAQSSAQISKAIDQETKPAGSTGQLNCTVSGIAAANAAVMWFKLEPAPVMISRNQQIVLRNPLVQGLKKYEILVTPVTSETQIYTLVNRRLTAQESGKYMCQIYLPGQDYDDLPKAIGHLVVQVHPAISDIDTTHYEQVAEGSNAVLTCDAAGVPHPTIWWTKANGMAMPNGQHTVFGTRLVFKNVTTTDSGVYRCNADNNVRPPATIDVTLQVRTKPVATAFRPAYGQARDMNLEVELTCIISGEPTPDLFWYYIKNKETMAMSPVTDDYKHEVHKIQMYPGHNRRETDQWLTLRIMQLQSGDYGTYMCLGKNQFGNGSAFMKLYATPTCQGPLCQFQSQRVGASSISASLALLLATLVMAVLVARDDR